VRLNLLQHLDLSFYSCEIRGRGLDDVAKGIEMLSSSLKSLNLHFRGDYILEDFSESLKKLRFLQSLSIWDLSIEDEYLKGLGGNLQGLIGLQSIKLCFQDNPLTENSLKYIGEGLEKLSSLSSLSSINLNWKYSSWENITDECLKSFTKTFQKHATLQSVTLRFHMLEKITDEGLRNLCESLKGLSSLRSINLSFNGWENLTDKGLKNLFEQFQKFSSLQSINLKFENCESITDEGLIFVGESLWKLRSLQSIRLNFEGCSKITNEGQESFYQNLKKLTNIEMISI